MAKREHYKILITDTIPLLTGMVEQAKKKYPDLVSKVEWILVDKGDEQELIDKVPGVDILVGARNRMTRNVFEKADKLIFVQQCSAGYDNVDLKAAREKGIDVSNAGGAGVIPVAEHTIMLMLAIAKNLAKSDSTMKAGEWIFGECMGRVYELYNKMLGIVGLGKIGSQVARLAHGFNMKLQYFDPYREDASDLNLPINKVSLEELMKTSDFVTINALLTPETRGIIGRKELEMMKETAYLINTSRGAIVDEEALADILEAKKIRGAGIDVYGEHGDPPAPDSRLRKLDNIVLTPHIGGVTAEDIYRNFYETSLGNIMAVVRGEEPKYVVN
ncbi:MAG TPA: hydroxyacid dehydrogenase [Dehalococcoidia bacterium]|nr:hydroxyacid dehydrogenase [Dehalococcoidia bacterium]